MHSDKNFCPLLNKVIEGEVCFDICLVAEGMSPYDELPIGMNLSSDDAKRCLECENHVE